MMGLSTKTSKYLALVGCFSCQRDEVGEVASGVCLLADKIQMLFVVGCQTPLILSSI